MAGDGMPQDPHMTYASDITAPLTRAEALARGITVTELAGPGYRRLYHGVYLPSHVPVTALQRARAALKIASEGAFVSHHTAAELWGGWVPESPDTHISVPGERVRSQAQGIRAHRAGSTRPPVARRGVPVSDPISTFLDLAGWLNLIDLVTLGDSLVHAKRCTPADLIAAAGAWTGRGCRLARRAAGLVRSGVDSPCETRLRLLVVLAGLPEPEVNVILRDQDGEWVIRLDMAYRLAKLILEYDGRQHADDPRQWSRDLLRREALEGDGWRLIVVNGSALFGDPAGTVQRIRDALIERGLVNRPRWPTAVWSRHFERRGAA